MPLTEEDARRLEALGHAREAFSFRNPETGHLQLRTVDPAPGETARPCYFLRDGRCIAYEHRPQGCRIYPLVLNEEGRLLRDEDCPHRREFPLDPSARRRILRIVGAVEREALKR